MNIKRPLTEKIVIVVTACNVILHALDGNSAAVAGFLGVLILVVARPYGAK